MTFARGYCPDPEGHQRTPFAHLAARMPLASASSASLEDSLPPPLDQGQTSSCTGHGFAVGCYAALKAAGDPLPWIPSPKGLYTLGRCVDRVPQRDGSLPMLTDDGASPNQVGRAANEWGIRPMTELARDGRLSDADPKTINDEPKLGELEVDRETIVVGEYGIYTRGAQRSADVRHALTNGFPVGVAVPGGSSAWQNYVAGHVIGATGDELDHFVVLVGYRTNADGAYEYQIRNSWGAGYGERGCCWVNEAALAEFGNLIALSVRRLRP